MSRAMMMSVCSTKTTPSLRADRRGDGARGDARPRVVAALVPAGGGQASQVLVGKRAGTITILRGTAPDLLEREAAREEGAELIGEEWPPQPAQPEAHRPFFPDEDDVEPVFVELPDARHAHN